MLRFSKQKCIDRLISTGQGEKLTPENLNIMDKLNNCPASASIFGDRIFLENFIFCNGRDGVGYYVRVEDCY